MKLQEMTFVSFWSSGRNCNKLKNEILFKSNKDSSSRGGESTVLAFWELKYVNEGGFQQRNNMKFVVCEMGVKTDFEFISGETFYLQ